MEVIEKAGEAEIQGTSKAVAEDGRRKDPLLSQEGRGQNGQGPWDVCGFRGKNLRVFRSDDSSAL